jgi:uncharacterized protein (DUF302 family)
MDTAGLTIIVSKHSVKVTIDRLAAAVKAAAGTVFARIDHGAGAADAGLPLGPTELLIFGNAKLGTVLMQANQAVGIDLPLKMLCWQDESGQVLLGYNQPQFIATRHGLGAQSAAAIAQMSQGLAKLALTATD